jgi:hypothetical protein
MRNASVDKASLMHGVEHTLTLQSTQGSHTAATTFGCLLSSQVARSGYDEERH